jgi:hypothetical protein
VGTRIAREAALTPCHVASSHELSRLFLQPKNSKLSFETPHRLYKFQSDIADDYDYYPNYYQADHSFDDDVEDVEPAAKYEHGEYQATNPPTKEQKEDQYNNNCDNQQR